MDVIDYEKEVRSKFPEAKCVGVGINGSKPIYYMIIGCSLKENYKDSKELAWKNAYDTVISSNINNYE